MKKALAALFIIAILFCGCEPAANKKADVITENGEYFLRVYYGQRLGSHDIKVATAFDSVDEIKRLIKTNSFTDIQINGMYNTFYTVKGDTNLLPIIDPDKILVPVFNGECDYYRLGFINRTFWCEIKTTYKDAEYKLNFDTSYNPNASADSYKESFYQEVQEEKYEEHLEYTEDGITKQALIYPSGKKTVQYETVIGNISYYVLEKRQATDAESNDNFAFFGKAEGVGSFYLRIYTKNNMDNETIRWIMESIELKKA